MKFRKDRGLTELQKLVLAAIRSDRAITMPEMANRVGCKSQNGTYPPVDALIEKGYLERIGRPVVWKILKR